MALGGSSWLENLSNEAWVRVVFLKDSIREVSFPSGSRSEFKYVCLC